MFLLTNYNTKVKIARNTVYFEGLYNQNEIKGTDLYLDTLNGVMKSKNTHFNIKEKDEIN